MLIAVLALLVSGCAANQKLQSPRARPPAKIGTKAVGIASWYGPGYHGNRTACGDRFDQDALTAALEHFTATLAELALTDAE